MRSTDKWNELISDKSLYTVNLKGEKPEKKDVSQNATPSSEMVHDVSQNATPDSRKMLHKNNKENNNT